MIQIIFNIYSLFIKDWEQYWSFYMETDDPPTVVTLSNYTLF